MSKSTYKSFHSISKERKNSSEIKKSSIINKALSLRKRIMSSKS